MNSAIEQLLQSTPQKDRPPGEFRFNETKDNLGIMLEHPSYVKPRCGRCYGKGYTTSLVGDGYLPDGTPRQARHQLTCVCVLRSYAKKRVAAERAHLAAEEKARGR